jgi:phosphoribosyl-ATP pyrophosphohydrolase/phosphoribosyl-AMP cyclohydrolase
MDFTKLNGILPAIIQDADTNRVLMLGFMNEEALEKTRADGLVTFYSRTRARLWTKGEESGNFLKVKEIIEDCDQDTLLIKATPVGPVCHTGSDTCFREDNRRGSDFLFTLQELIHSRREEMPENSYTSKLFSEGINRIAQKVGEEAVELVIEAKDADNNRFLNEAADLVYHLMVLLASRGYGIQDVAHILEERHK